MSRSARLLDLIQVLRRHRRPISGQVLATELGVSLRTIYRDIATLIAQGAPVEGEAGIGYVLRPGFTLPPLMFTPEEIEALVLGSRWVAQRADKPLAEAARNALAKIGAVLPEDMNEGIEATGLLAPPGDPLSSDPTHLTLIREAIRREHKLVIGYANALGEETRRIIWPLALAFFDRALVLAAWCEMRQGFRHFRLDRLMSLTERDERYPGRRRALLKAWREAENIPEHIW
jgi:predicted DNA-binding transcriptional regulator YafY